MPAEPNGPSAVVIAVPAAEPVVGHWRQQHDLSAAQGMPAHITILYPFLAQHQFTIEVMTRLEAIIAGQQEFALQLGPVRRFPAGALYLTPQPAEPIRELTGQMVAAWPQCPPYGGLFDQVIPHLTVAGDADDEITAVIESDISAALPITTVVREAWLYVPDGQRWHPWRRLPFSPATQS